MANLTISIDDELIKRARVRAIQQGTSVSAKLREFLQAYVEESEDTLRRQRLDAAATLRDAIEAATAQAQASSGSAVPSRGAGSTLRDDLYGGDFRGRDRPSAGPDPAT